MMRVKRFLKRLNQLVGTGLISDLWHHLVMRTICVVARRHVGSTPEIGVLTKRGFRGGSVVQCRFCHEMKFASDHDAHRYGGRR